MSSDRAASEPSPGGRNRLHQVAFHPQRPRVLLVGESAGIGPTVALAERLRGPVAGRAHSGDMAPSGCKPLVLLGSDEPFPFRARPSSIIVAGIPSDVIACMPLLEEWGVPCRLASPADLPGCFEGSVAALAAAWLGSLGPDELRELELFACGPATLLEQIEALAERYGVPCQVVQPDPVSAT